MDIGETAALLQLLEVSNRYPLLRPIHDSALRQLGVIAQGEAEAWAKTKADLDAKAAVKAADAAAKAKAAADAAAPAARRSIPPATVSGDA